MVVSENSSLSIFTVAMRLHKLTFAFVSILESLCLRKASCLGHKGNNKLEQIDRCLKSYVPGRKKSNNFKSLLDFSHLGIMSHNVCFWLILFSLAHRVLHELAPTTSPAPSLTMSSYAPSTPEVILNSLQFPKYTILSLLHS